MKRYETIMIFDPDLPEAERNPLRDKFKDQISQQGGNFIQFDEWGNRKLAYEIKKKVRGFYLRMDYCGSGALVDELERLSRIDDRVLKYMTILIDDNADPEQIHKEMADMQAKSAAVEQADTPKADQSVPESGASEKPETEKNQHVIKEGE